MCLCVCSLRILGYGHDTRAPTLVVCVRGAGRTGENFGALSTYFIYGNRIADSINITSHDSATQRDEIASKTCGRTLSVVKIFRYLLLFLQWLIRVRHNNHASRAAYMRVTLREIRLGNVDNCLESMQNAIIAGKLLFCTGRSPLLLLLRRLIHRTIFALGLPPFFLLVDILLPIHVAVGLRALSFLLLGFARVLYSV